MNQTYNASAEKKQLKGHTEGVTTITFSPDSQVLVLGSFDQTARTWDMYTFDEIQKPKDHDNGVMAMAFSANGRRLATVIFMDAIMIWDAKTGELSRKLNYWGLADFSLLLFSPDSLLLTAVLYNKFVMLWNVETDEMQTLGSYNETSAALGFSPNSRLLASASNGTMKIWRIGGEIRRPVDPEIRDDLGLEDDILQDDSELDNDETGGDLGPKDDILDN